MTDRFKFRFYDTLNNKMLYMDGFLLGGGLEQRLRLKNQIGEWLNYNLETTKIMQCTGLKDKNGKLEFQGDFLKDILGNIYELKYEVNSCGFLLYNHKNDEYYYPCYNTNQFKNRNITEMEVIGNIYENPQLLEANNVNL